MNATQDDLERQVSGEQENLEGTIDPVEGTARELELDQIKEQPGEDGDDHAREQVDAAWPEEAESIDKDGLKALVADIFSKIENEEIATDEIIEEAFADLEKVEGTENVSKNVVTEFLKTILPQKNPEINVEQVEEEKE